MTFQEFNSILKKQVEDLDNQKCLDLALSICKRLFPDYQYFHQEKEWGNPDELIDAIRFIENHSAKQPDKAVVEAIINRVMEVTPDTEEFEDASYALNACCAVCSTLSFLLDSNNEHIFHVSIYLIDTINARVQEDNDLTEEEIDQHSLMVDTRTYLLEAIRPYQ